VNQTSDYRISQSATFSRLILTKTNPISMDSKMLIFTRKTLPLDVLFHGRSKYSVFNSCWLKNYLPYVPKCSLRQLPKSKTSAKKKYFTISYTYYIKLVRLYLPLPISVSHLQCHSTTYHHQSCLLCWINSASYNLTQLLLVRYAAMPLRATPTNCNIYI
jgi:hypothetical protein